MLVLAMLMVLGAQSHWQLPVTIQVEKDVEAKPFSVLQPPGGGLLREVRGVLYLGLGEKAFRIKKGLTFQMISIGDEGGCEIRFEKKDYQLSSCPWLEGFTDRQADIFRVIARK